MDLFIKLFFMKGEQSSEFYETLFELEGDRSEEKGAFWEQNISLAWFYNVEPQNHQKRGYKKSHLRSF